MIDKYQILSEIKRLAIANGGKAPGRGLFERKTGIKQSDWYPDIWLSWSEALAEAGYRPNQLQIRIGDDVLIQRYIGLIRELKRLPVIGEIRRKAKHDKSFPSHTVFDRFGGKEKLIAAVLAYCSENPGFEDVEVLCAEHRQQSIGVTGSAERGAQTVVTGFVYLMKSGRHYKIGERILWDVARAN